MSARDIVLSLLQNREWPEPAETDEAFAEMILDALSTGESPLPAMTVDAVETIVRDGFSRDADSREIAKVLVRKFGKPADGPWFWSSSMERWVCIPDDPA